MAIQNSTDASSVDYAAGLRYSFATSQQDLATCYADADDSATAQLTLSTNGSYTLWARVFDKDNGFAEYQRNVYAEPSYGVSGYTYHDLNRNGFWDQAMVVGDQPDIVFIIDRSGSTYDAFGGTSVGNVNSEGDNLADSTLDAELAGCAALVRQLVSLGYGSRANISVVLFNDQVQVHNLSPLPGQTQLIAMPGQDIDGNGELDIIEALKHVPGPGSGTSFNLPLAKASQIFDQLGTSKGNANVIFLSDGANNGWGFQEEVAALKNSALAASIRAFGVGPWSDLAQLKMMDPMAARFSSTDEILSVFSGLAPGEAAETALGGRRVYVDLNGNDQYDAGEPSAISSSDPLNPGYYQINGLVSGSYSIRQEATQGWLVTGPKPAASALEPGEYQVALGSGDSASYLNFGSIEDRPVPAAVVTAPATVAERALVTVTVTNPTGTAPFRYSYDFNNDGDFDDAGDIYRSASGSASYTFDDGPGVQDSMIHVRVHDAIGQSHDYQQPVHVTNVAPVAFFSGLPDTVDLSRFGNGPAKLRLVGTAQDVSDADTKAGFQYEWTVTRNGQDFAAGAGSSFDFLPDMPGTYTVVLRVTDKDGDIGPFSRTAEVIRSVPQITAVSYPTTVTGTQATLSVTASDDVGESNLRYYWGCDRADTVEGLQASGSNAAKQITLTFKAAGTYQFNVYAVDADGNYDSREFMVHVAAMPTALAITPGQAIAAPNGGQQQFSVSVFDQFGSLVNGVAPVWSIANSPAHGGINATTGLYTSSTTPGIDTIQATLGELQAQAQVLVSDASNYDMIGAASAYTIVEGQGVGASQQPGDGLAGFVDSLPGTTVDSYTATISWGDGSEPEAARVSTYVIDGYTAFEIFALSAHTYTTAGSYALSVTLLRKDGSLSKTVSNTVTATPAALRYQLPIFSPVVGQPYSGPVFRLVSDNASDTPSLYTADIAWGDGAVSTGVAVNANFEVIGNHTYTSTGLRTLTITLYKNGQEVFPAASRPTQQIRVVSDSVVAPVALRTFVISASQLGVVWKQVDGAQGYIVWAYNTATGEKRRLPASQTQITGGTPTDTDPAHELYYVDQFLPAGTTFTYSVQAVYGNGAVSAESNGVNATTPSNKTVARPSELSGHHLVVGYGTSFRSIA